MGTMSLYRRILSLFGTFLFLGVITFGGGMAMMPLLHRELVVRRRWLTEEEFLEVTSASTAIPGAIAVNMAMLVGHRLGGVVGAVAAGLGCVLPSFGIILAVALGGSRFLEEPAVKRFFAGAGAAVTGLIAYAAVKVGRGTITGWRGLVIAAVGLGLIVGLGIHPLWAIL